MFVHRVNIFLLSAIISLFPAFVYAGAAPQWYPNGSYAINSVQVAPNQMTAEINAAKEYQAAYNGSKLYATSTKAITVAANDVGGVMNGRLAFLKTGGVALLGVGAVQALLEGIGWVMKEGTYVKIKEPDVDPKAYNYRWQITNTVFCYNDSNCSSRMTAVAANNPNFNEGRCTSQPNTQIHCDLYRNNVDTGYDQNLDRQINPDYDPNAGQPKPQLIPLTPDLLTAAIFHQGYADPVDSTKNAQVNTGTPDGDIIKDAATRDEAQPDNPIADAIDAALDAAPKTQTGDGTQGSTDTKSETKPDANGNPTTSSAGTFKLPAFCDWATALCDHIKWLEKAPEAPTEPTTVDISEQPSTPPTININFGGSCPMPLTYHVSIGQWIDTDFVFSFDSFCSALAIAKPVIIACASLTAVYIIAGRQEQEG